MGRISRYQIRLYDDRHADLIEQLDTYLAQKREAGVPANHALAELLSAALSCRQSDGGYQVLLSEIQDLKSRLNRGIMVMSREETPIDEPEAARTNLDAQLKKFRGQGS